MSSLVFGGYVLWIHGWMAPCRRFDDSECARRGIDGRCGIASKYDDLVLSHFASSTSSCLSNIPNIDAEKLEDRSPKTIPPSIHNDKTKHGHSSH